MGMSRAIPSRINRRMAVLRPRVFCHNQMADDSTARGVALWRTAARKRDEHGIPYCGSGRQYVEEGKVTGIVALLGATGFTGRLVAAELAGRSRSCRLGARSLDRLSRLPRGDQIETFRVDVNDHAQLDRFLQGANVLINTVGPFKEFGLPVVEAAVRNGVAYLDSTGEPNFMEEIYRRFRDAPVPVVPGCGFDSIPGDLAAAITAADLGGAVTEVGVHFEVRGIATVKLNRARGGGEIEICRRQVKVRRLAHS
jgi:hypothetical protein